MKGNFQIILLIVFIIGAVFAVLVFSGKIQIGGNNTSGPKGTVILWGTDPYVTISPILADFNSANGTFTVKYVQKNLDTFDQDLLEALASGVGPDLFFLPDNLVYSYRNRIYPTPYQTYPLATFKSAFTNAGDVFLTSKGVTAFPISVDPMVMYYNRNMLDANNIVYPPSTWDDLVSLVPTLTQKDDTKKILRSAVALGQYSNVTHAKDILSALFMQTGNSITAEKGGSFISMLNQDTLKYHLDSVLGFYTNFSNPLNDVYSWNRSLPNSVDAFSREDLAFYFGYASELQSLQKRNPNQNFLVAPFPQLKGANFKSTMARVTGIAVSSFSKNFTTAFTAASLMATGDFASKYSTATGTIPARRDLIAATKPTDAYLPVFYSSALYARSWLDPSPGDTDNIFQKMIDGVLSNTMSVKEALDDSEQKMNLLLTNSR